MSDNNITIKVKEALEAGVIIGDGHGLYEPSFYEPHFTIEELNEAELIETHKSDGTHKGTIFGPDGQIVPQMQAVYNLDFLYWVAGLLGVTDYPRSMGRGSQAQELVGFIRKALPQ
jgi:hypothetical protein